MLLEGPISPMLATPGRALRHGDGWVLEPKWDGWRVLAHVTPSGARIFTRHGEGHHRRPPAIAAALAELPHGTVLDGELVCLQPIEGGPARLPWHQRRKHSSVCFVGATGVLRLTPVLDATAAVHDALVADGWEGRGREAH